MEQIEVLIVEDDFRVGSEILRVLSMHPEFRIAGFVDRAELGLQALRRGRPHVLLVDLQLPDGDGETVITAARKENLADSILVFSMFGDEERVLRAIEAGADGYLLKGCSDTVLVNSLKEAANGESPISPAIARHILRHMRKSPANLPTRPAPDEPDALSDREVEVLGFVAQGYIAEEVADRLSLSVHTVRAHIRNIYGKLHVNRLGQAISEARKRGYI